MEMQHTARHWTQDVTRGLRLARALRNGNVRTNQQKRFAEAETGGYRQSVLGHLHGYDALADFTQLKHAHQSPGVVQAGL